MEPTGEIKVEINKPLVLTDRQKWLCSHLDALNKVQQFCPNAKPSDLFIGALYALKADQSSTNPDRIAQSAHSLREIMYGIGVSKRPKNKWLLILYELFKLDKKATSRRERIKNIIEVYQEEKKATELAKILNDLHFIFTNVAHHNQDGSKQGGLKRKIAGLGVILPSAGVFVTEATLSQLIELLENAWTRSIPHQLTIHKRIEDFLKDNSTADKELLGILISFNPDARQYFYSVADERWIDWLWSNGFLDLLKQAPEKSDSYGYRTPEISYLVKVAPKAPVKVAEIILDDNLATTEQKFRPELIDQILRICENLPQPQLAQVIQKIHRQEWARIMAPFNRWGFEYEKIFEVLKSANDYETLFLLAESVLSIRSKEADKEKESRLGSTNPFYFNELSYTKVFGYLADVPDEFSEQSFTLVSKILSKIVLLGGESEKGDTFPIQDSFYLFDVDFFTLELDSKKPLSYRDDVRELVAVIKTLADKLIKGNCSNPTRAREYYEKYVATLPDSCAMWRFRLYVLSLCPNIFATELRSSFFRLFDTDKYHNVTSGAEYEKSLQVGFSTLSAEDKEKYVTNIIEYFTRIAKEHPDQNWHMRHGSEILTMIQSELTTVQKDRVTSSGFSFITNYEPSPSIGEIRGGTVRTRGPITQEEFDALPLSEVTEKLRSEWSPKQLRETYKKDDFLNPRNAEGAGDLVKNGISKRLQKYVNNADLFFERDVLDAHYTYSYFRGIEESIKNNRPLADSIDWTPLIRVCLKIAQSGLDKPFEFGRREREVGDAWLAGWDGVHSGIADVFQILLKEENGKLPIDFAENRNAVFDIISYLLSYPDPIPKDEEPDTASMKVSSGGEPQLVGDPFTMAINSARGRAFQVFVLFIYLDGKQFDKDIDVRITDDVKKLYERVLLAETTRAIMFMFGHYLPQFYYRDIKWIRELLPTIFPEAQDKSHLYLAAWEGYLANNLYKEMFDDPEIQKLYFRGVDIARIKENTRRYFRDPDEGIATHMALAFIHYEHARFEHPLFKAFWAKGDIEERKGFVSFIGRSVVSGDNSQIDEYLKQNPSVKDLLKTLWDWILENNTEPEVFMEFGFWANLKKEIFEPVWLAERIRKTLEKTKGVFDWDYGLTQISIELSKSAPEEMLKITRLFFIDGGIRAGHQRRPYYVEREWFDVFRNLHINPTTKQGTIELIDDLIREGGNPFWGLKDILN